MTQDALQRIKERYRDLADYYAEQTKLQRKDLHFSNPSNPQQWDDDVRKARESAPGGARPCLTFDYTNQFIMQVVNDARQNKPGIQVIPATSGADIQTANAIEGMIRHIEYSSRASMAYDTAIDHAARCGTGYMRIVTEVTNAARNEQEIRIKTVHDPLSIKLDPDSIELDGSDATDGFIESKISISSYEAKYGKKASSDSFEVSDGWMDDKSIRICEYYQLITTKRQKLEVLYSNGTTGVHTQESYAEAYQTLGYAPHILNTYDEDDRHFKWCLLNGSEILEETIVLSKWIPIVPVYGNVLWIDGKRYVSGLTRQLMDGQKAKNYERTAQIEMIALQPKSPFILPFESVEGFEDEWKNANTANTAYLPYNALDQEGRPLPSPQRLAPPQIPAAFIQGAQQASDDMQAAIGMYKSNLGAPSNAVSGRAKMQDQREGDTATYHYVDNQRRSIEQVGRIIVNMIPSYYDTAREVRILGLNGDAKPIKINPSSANNHTGKIPEINPAIGTYDVRIKAGPAYATLRQEANDSLTELVGKNPAMMAVLGPTWARLQDWPDSDKVAKLLLTMAPPAVQAIENEATKLPPEAEGIVSQLKAQIQQLTEQLKQVSQAADTNMAQVHQDHEKNEIEKQKAQISAYDAETKRLQVLMPALNPLELNALAMQLVTQAITPEEIKYEDDRILDQGGQMPMGHDQEYGNEQGMEEMQGQQEPNEQMEMQEPPSPGQVM